MIILLSLPALAQISKSSAPAAANNATTIQAYFGPKAADDNTGPLFNLLRFLDTAQTSIYGSIHEIDMIVVADNPTKPAKVTLIIATPTPTTLAYP